VSELRRELSLLDSTMINAGTMIASAIFIVPASIALQLGATGPILLVWVVGGVISLLGALAVAELGAAMPAAGGQYAYLGEAYGPLWGFLYGWTGFLVINTASIAAIAVGFATYLGHFTPLDTTAVKVIAIGSIALLTLINCLGVRLGAWVQNILTALKVGALLAICVLAFALPGGSVAHLVPIWPDGSVGQLVGPFALAMVSALWAYDGWIEITYVGSEVRDPQRVLPRSILLSVLAVTALFLVVNLAYLYLLSPVNAGRSGLIAADAARVVLGPIAVTLTVLAILVATLGANNGIVLTAARIPYAMARNGEFFQWAGRVNARFRTPVAALLVQGAMACAFTLSGTYNQLITYVVFTSFLFYGMSAAAVIVLRRRRPDLPRPYRTWGYPVTPALFVVCAAAFMISTIAEAPREAAIGAAIVLAGVPAFWFWKGKKRET
jgi:basic amino acid/polyamine antiporter, APA family